MNNNKNNNDNKKTSLFVISSYFVFVLLCFFFLLLFVSLSFLFFLLQTLHQDMRSNDSLAGCHVVIWYLSTFHKAFAYIFTIFSATQVNHCYILRDTISELFK